MMAARIEPPHLVEDSEHEWPRDFDFRIEFAEQQELLSVPLASTLTSSQSSGPDSDE